jgi:UDP:flavonoid glycosyltransferase YjiC (YdhE family)
MNKAFQGIMKIVLATCGTRGDVQPILALALALKYAGHEVLVAAPPENAAWVSHYDCPFRARTKTHLAI